MVRKGKEIIMILSLIFFLKVGRQTIFENKQNYISWKVFKVKLQFHIIKSLM